MLGNRTRVKFGVRNGKLRALQWIDHLPVKNSIILRKKYWKMLHGQHLPGIQHILKGTKPPPPGNVTTVPAAEDGRSDNMST